MANQREYTIIINGVEQSLKSVEKLGQALDNLDKNLLKEREVEAQTVATKKETAKTNDELAKATDKLNSYDQEYAKQLQTVKTSLAELQKETKKQVQAEKDAQIVQGEVGKSYYQRQEYLSALNRQIRSFVVTNEEEQKQLEGMIKKSAEIQQYLKDFDSQQKIYTRNVGNYQSALEGVAGAQGNMKRQTRELRDAIADMLANGVDPADPKLQEMAKSAGKMRDAMGDADNMIAQFASDTGRLDQVVGAFKSATSVMQLYQGSMALLGKDSEEFQKNLQKLVAIQSVFNSLQSIQADLLNQNTLLFKGYNKITGAFKNSMDAVTKSTKVQTVAWVLGDKAAKLFANGLKVVKVGLMSIGIGLVTTAVAYLVSEWDNLTKLFKQFIPWADKAGEAFDKIKAVIVTLGSVVLKETINTFKTLGSVIYDVFTLNFKDIAKDIKDGVNDAVKAVQDAGDVYEKKMDEYEKERQRDRAKKLAKQIEDELAVMEARYTGDLEKNKEYVAKKKQLLDLQLKAEEEGSEEYKKALLEKYRYERDLEKKALDEKKKADEERKKLNEEYNKNLKKAVEDNKKLSQENRKVRLDLEKDAIGDTIAQTREQLGEKVKLWKAYYVQVKDMAEQSYKEEQEAVKTSFTEMMKQAVKAGKDTVELQGQMLTQLTLLNDKHNALIDKLNREEQEAIKKSNENFVKEQIQSLDKQIDFASKTLQDRLSNITKADYKKKGNSNFIDVEESKKAFSEAKKAYEQFLKDLEETAKEQGDKISAMMERLNPDTEEYARLLDKRRQLDKKYADDKKKINAELEENERKSAEIYKKVAEEIGQTISSISSYAGDFTGAIGDVLKQRVSEIETQIESITGRKDLIDEQISETESRINELKAGMQNASAEQAELMQTELLERQANLDEQRRAEEKYNQEISKLEKKKRQEEAKATRTDLANKLLQSIANTAVGITGVWANPGFPAAIPLTAVVGATGAIQTALIASQMGKIKYAKGGLLQGPSHSQGGIPVGNTGIEVEGNEYVVNKRSTAKFLPLLEAINNYGRPRDGKYANGGTISVENLREVDNTQNILRRIEAINFNPVVSVQEITRTQQNIARVQELAR